MREIRNHWQWTGCDLHPNAELIAAAAAQMHFEAKNMLALFPNREKQR